MAITLVVDKLDQKFFQFCAAFKAQFNVSLLSQQYEQIEKIM